MPFREIFNVKKFLKQVNLASIITIAKNKLMKTFILITFMLNTSKTFWSRILVLKLPDKNRLQYSCILKTDELRPKQVLVREAKIGTLLSTNEVAMLARLRHLLDTDLWQVYEKVQTLWVHWWCRYKKICYYNFTDTPLWGA